MTDEQTARKRFVSLCEEIGPDRMSVEYWDWLYMHTAEVSSRPRADVKRSVTTTSDFGPPWREHHLLEARNLLYQVASSLDLTQYLCYCCSSRRYARFNAHKMHEELKGMITKIEKWIKAGDAIDHETPAPKCNTHQ
jgi:hypothetical protein